jgi:hypothetical protein
MAQRQQHEEDPGRLYPTKAIRVVSLAPDLDNSDDQVQESPREPAQQAEVVRSQFALMQYLALLEEEPNDEDGELEVLDAHDEDDEWEDEDDSD